jgi:hypothetical protein
MNPEELAGRGITVHIIKGYGDPAVAERAIALMEGPPKDSREWTAGCAPANGCASTASNSPARCSGLSVSVAIQIAALQHRSLRCLGSDGDRMGHVVAAAPGAENLFTNGVDGGLTRASVLTLSLGPSRRNGIGFGQ